MLSSLLGCGGLVGLGTMLLVANKPIFSLCCWVFAVAVIWARENEIRQFFVAVAFIAIVFFGNSTLETIVPLDFPPLITQYPMLFGIIIGLFAIFFAFLWCKSYPKKPVTFHEIFQSIDAKREAQKALKEAEEAKNAAILADLFDGEEGIYINFKTPEAANQYRWSYKRYCGYLLERDGWEVEYSGILYEYEGKQIDLYAFSHNRLIIAHCEDNAYEQSNWAVRLDVVSEFVEEIEAEKVKNLGIQVIGIFFAKYDSFKVGCKERLEANGILVKIEEYNNQYPCVKCIAASGLYYVLQHREYDKVAFSIHRGDRYCYDGVEAEKLGFREA